MRAEIDRRVTALRTEHPAARRREALERDLTHATGSIERLIEAYQEQLMQFGFLGHVLGGWTVIESRGLKSGRSCYCCKGIRAL